MNISPNELEDRPADRLNESEGIPDSQDSSSRREGAVDFSDAAANEGSQIKDDEGEPGMSSSPDEHVVLNTSVEEDYYSAGDEEEPDRPLSFKERLSQREAQAKWWCCPQGITVHSIPLSLATIALTLTGYGSWGCSYFVGATTNFTGHHYGLWTLENVYGKCQLWDVLFFSYSLGGFLQAARALSMTAMVLGLSLVTSMAQALQSHILGWGIGLALFVLFILSVSTTSQYNLWTLFFLFLYVVLVLIVRSLFIHPLHRVISKRGSKYIAWLLMLCFLCTLFTLVVLNSYFCQCENLTPERLEGRGGEDVCEQRCRLGPAGITTVIAAGMWLLSSLAVFKFGVQPPWYMGEPSTRRFGDYTRDSITTKTRNAAKQFANFSVNSPKVVAAAVSRSLGSSEHVEEARDGANENEDEENRREMWAQRPQRTRSQKLCCDFRVTGRTRMEKVEFCCFRCGLSALVVIFIFIVVMLCGSRYEKLQAERAPETTPNFVTNATCAFNASNPSAPFMYYSTAEEALADNMTVAHCGECAHCSNIKDIETYVKTRKSITIQAKKCGKIAVFGSTEDLHECLNETIGFSDDCRRCWVENMQCDAKLCIFTCMKTLFTGFLARNNVPQSGDTGRLNWCLQCDEKRCGTAFVTCSGVARRRLGIESAIERNRDEICPLIETPWDEYPFPIP